MNETNTQVPEALTPGQMLQAAREQRGLTPLAVATKLCWSSQRVKDIEADDYQHITAKIYAQGYLRSYVRLLELDESLLVDSFNRLRGVKGWEGSTQHFNVNPVPVYQQHGLHRGKSHLMRWSSLAVVLVLVVMVVMWRHGQGTHNTLVNNNGSLLNTPAVVQASNGTAIKIKKLPIQKHLVVAAKARLQRQLSAQRLAARGRRTAKHVLRPSYSVAPVTSNTPE